MSSMGVDLNVIAPSVPVDKGRIVMVVDHPQQVKLLHQGFFVIELGICRATAAVVAGVTLLGLGCGYHLAISIERGQAEIESGLSLQ